MTTLKCHGKTRYRPPFGTVDGGGFSDYKYYLDVSPSTKTPRQFKSVRLAISL